MGTLCTSGVAIFKAGVGMSGTLLTETDYDTAIQEAEGTICAATRFNWIDVFAGLNADVKYILEAVASDLAGVYLINHYMGGYTTRIEAEDQVNILRDRALFGISILRDKKVQKFIREA